MVQVATHITKIQIKYDTAPAPKRHNKHKKPNRCRSMTLTSYKEKREIITFILNRILKRHTQNVYQILFLFCDKVEVNPPPWVYIIHFAIVCCHVGM